LISDSILLFGALLLPLFHIGGSFGVKLYRNIERRLLHHLVLFARAMAELSAALDSASFPQH